jgi:riboflavin kinase/FMN adenylyltransferase
MKVYNEIPEKKGAFNNPVLTIGSFDGVHLGHRRIISTLLNISRQKGGVPVVLTFDTHPRKILFPETPPKILTTKKEKIKALGGCGIENIIILHFTKEMAEMHAIDFLSDIVFDKLGVLDIVVGYDHAFGRHREGNIDFLKKLSKEKGFGVTRVDHKDYESRPISSTWIRAEIEDGNITFANELLGRRYTLFGKVVKGEGRGRKLNFPTANVLPDDTDKVIPKDGVYAVTVDVGSTKLGGMLNIGTNPTFANTERTIEVNILDFDKDVYDADIEIEFHERVRDEIKFGSSEDLIKQLKKDQAAITEILSKQKDESKF